MDASVEPCPKGKVKSSPYPPAAGTRAQVHFRLPPSHKRNLLRHTDDTTTSTERIYVDHGLTGTNRDRPGLRQALAACRRGDTLVVTKLDRLARSVPDARDIVDELTAGGVRLNIGGSLHDPTDPVGRLLFTTLSMIAEFEADLARARTREGMAVARAKGRLRGKQPKLSPKQEAHLVELYRGGKHTIGELEELFPVTRSTIYRAVARADAHTSPPAKGTPKQTRSRRLPAS